MQLRLCLVKEMQNYCSYNLCIDLKSGISDLLVKTGRNIFYFVQKVIGFISLSVKEIQIKSDKIKTNMGVTRAMHAI